MRYCQGQYTEEPKKKKKKGEPDLYYVHFSFFERCISFTEFTNMTMTAQDNLRNLHLALARCTIMHPRRKRMNKLLSNLIDRRSF